MVLCWAYGCQHYNRRETCRFYRIPKEPKLRKKWLTLLRRTDTPGKFACVCSCHFRDGRKGNLPEIMIFNNHKKFEVHYLTPEKKKRRVRKPASINVPRLNFNNMNEEVTVNTNGEEPMPKQSSTNLHETIGSINTITNNTETQPCQLPKEATVKPVSVSASQISPVALEAENYFLRQELEEEKFKTLRSGEKFSYSLIKMNNKLVLLYTGIPDAKIFENLCELFENIKINYKFQSHVNLICRTDQLLMTLMKLRHNFPHEDLQFRFKVSRATVSNIIITWIHLLKEILFDQFMDKVPSINKNKSCLPSCFCTFTNCRIIIDCTEIFMIVSRKSMNTQRTTYSSYKHRNTMKVLVGVAPNGVITYVSNLYGGSVSDKKIVQNCGLLDQLSAGDLIIADKGFLIRDILPTGVSLNIPPFLQSPQFTPHQIEQTKTIARARIHVERAIRRMKCFKILSTIPHSLAQYADVIVKAVAALTNLQYPLIKEVEAYYVDTD